MKKNVCASSNLRRGITRLAMILTLLTGLGTAAWGQAPPYALMQDSTLTGTGNTINVTQLPVVTTSGISYVDLTILFDVAADGTLTVAPGYPLIVPAPEPIVDGFEAGNYSETAGGEAVITVSGPGVASSGATVWSLTEHNAVGCINPGSATWYDVGTSIKNNPLYLRLKAAGITSTQFTQFGVGSGCGLPYWGTNTLLGFTQTANALVVSSYTNSSKDQSTPVATSTFILIPQ